MDEVSEEIATMKTPVWGLFSDRTFKSKILDKRSLCFDTSNYGLHHVFLSETLP